MRDLLVLTSICEQFFSLHFLLLSFLGEGVREQWGGAELLAGVKSTTWEWFAANFVSVAYFFLKYHFNYFNSKINFPLNCPSFPWKSLLGFWPGVDIGIMSLCSRFPGFAHHWKRVWFKYSLTEYYLCKHQNILSSRNLHAILDHNWQAIVSTPDLHMYISI